METSYLPVARVDELAGDTPAHAMADGRVEGPNLICGVHGWDYRLDTGISASNPAERISKFTCLVEDGKVLVAQAEIAA